MSSRHSIIRSVALAAAFLWASAAAAQEPREFCPDRPGLGTPACTIDAGRFAVELGLLDRTLDREAGDRAEAWSVGDLLVRYGLDARTEVQLGWSAFGRVETRTGGVREDASGTGDLLVALRRNLVDSPSGFALAVMPYVTLPTGSSDIGAGDWGGGVLVPMSHALPGGFQLGLTLSADAAVDADGDGRHFAASAILGLDVPLAEALGATAELAVVRDDDPLGEATEVLAGLSAGWSPNDDLQLDVGVNVGLNRAAADLQLYVGVARRF
jgi:hypothetical protein